MFPDKLRTGVEALGLTLTDEQIEKFTAFYEDLVETNKVMNLTAITDEDGVAIKHMSDSLSCYDRAVFAGGARVLDLGTGAGFPGLPLLIYQDTLQVTFFDSLQKRLRFVQGVVEKLGLSAQYLHGRAEDMAHDKRYREAYDVVTTRAVARLNVLAEWALPYVRLGGTFVALKGAQYEEEIEEARNALSILGGTVKAVRPVKLAGLDDKRAVIYIEKTVPSPKKYPRKPKMASRNPL